MREPMRTKACTPCLPDGARVTLAVGQEENNNETITLAF